MVGGNLGMLSEAIIDVMMLVDGTKLLIEAEVGGGTAILVAVFMVVLGLGI